jgi:hypothetical protein
VGARFVRALHVGPYYLDVGFCWANLISFKN